MTKTEFIWKDKDGNIIDREVRYDLSGKWEKGDTVDPREIRKKSKLLQKGFSNLTEEEKGEWIKYFGENDNTEE